MRWVGFIVLGLLLLPLALAAQIQGTIYDDNLRLATNTLLSVNSTPEQRLLSTQGTYTFSLIPGTYEITAHYTYEGSEYLMREELTIREAGNYVFDLFLFPALDQELDFVDFPLPTDLVEETSEPSIILGDTTRTSYWSILFRFIGVTIFFLVVFFVYKMVRSRTQNVLRAADPLEEQLIKLLKKNSNRMTQKDIRKHFPHSEATISLLLSELEEKKVVEKIKKGRTNIIVLKK